MKKRPFEERLWEKIKKGTPDECWPWQASGAGGYGRINKDGRLVYAHREVFLLEVGPLEEKEGALHTCDNPPCCNPAHLFPGTHQENMQDRNRKGRQARHDGEFNNNARLTRQEASELRDRYLAGGVTQRKLAEERGISQALVSRIVTGSLWAK